MRAGKSLNHLTNVKRFKVHYWITGCTAPWGGGGGGGLDLALECLQNLPIVSILNSIMHPDT